MIYDSIFRFKHDFDKETGFYFRSNVLDENGNDTGEEPFMASFPHLIDVGIMGHCIHGISGLCKSSGVACYQSGALIQEPNMSINDFESIAMQCSGRTDQFALGGRGDPNQHEHFEEILHICRQNQIVPNYTTSGFNMIDKQIALTKEFCGSVAVSWYRNKYSIEAINKLVEAGCKVNVHYVLSYRTIEEALDILSNGFYCDGINAVIFLMHKPIGQGQTSDVLKIDDMRVKWLCDMINFGHRDFKIGFDSCSVPMLLNFVDNLDYNTVDTCEGGRFSCYISSDMIMSPCSFDRKEKYGVSLRSNSIERAWFSHEFDEFRHILKNACMSCNKRNLCMGGCPLDKSIVLCEHI